MSTSDKEQLVLRFAENSSKFMFSPSMDIRNKNSSLQNDDNSLVLNRHKLVRADNPSDLKRGGVCIYFKESLPIKVLNV